MSSTTPSSRRASRRGSLTLPKSTPKGAQRALRDAVHLRSFQSFITSGGYSRTLAFLCIALVVGLVRLAMYGAARTSGAVRGATAMVAEGREATDRAFRGGVSGRIRPQFASEGGIPELRQLLLDVAGPVPVMGTGGVGTARNGGPNVTVVAVNFAYRELAMNFVCRLGRLGIDQAYVILAMDRAMYTYASARGVNVFYHSVHASEMKESMEKGRNSDGSDVPAVDSDEDHGKGDDNDTGFKFGSRGFVRTSRRKSMLVAEVLALGYDVFFSDVDVILYSNPHAVFRDYAEDFVVMSDSHLFNRTQALNYNLNSGFYYVRARPRNYVALRAIVKYGEKSKRSEQKAFNHVLCGAFKDDTAGPGWRFGDNRCYYRIMGGVSTRVLSTSEFPNGSDASLFELPPSIVDAVSPGMVALHVNHVSGRDTKMSRIKGIGQWFYDTDGCQQVPAEEEMNPELAEKDRQQAVSDFRRNRSRQYIFQSDMPLDENEVTRNIHRGERHDWAQPEANLEALLLHEARMEAQKQKQRLEQDQEVHEVRQHQEEGRSLTKIETRRW